jgi:hypothetical protein
MSLVIALAQCNGLRKYYTRDWKFTSGAGPINRRFVKPCGIIEDDSPFRVAAVALEP